MTYSQSTTLNPVPKASALSTPNSSIVEQRFQAIEQRMEASATRMDNIEVLCHQLKGNTDMIYQQLSHLTASFTAASVSSDPCCSPAQKSHRTSGGH